MEDLKRVLWGVRGISHGLANKVAASAKAKGVLLGEWVTEALEAKLELERSDMTGRARHDPFVALVARLSALEDQLIEAQERLSALEETKP